MRRPHLTLLSLLASAVLVAGGAVPAQSATAAAAPALSCGEMLGQKVEVTADDTARTARVRSAVTVPTTAGADGYCELQGTIGEIRFTMRLPLGTWNGRYF